MVPQVEVRTRMDPLDLLEAEREFELDIGGRIGIMGQFVVIVEPVMFVAEPKRTVPFHAGLAPMVEPFELLARAHEKLHLHLFELAHAENELPGNDLVAESLADLRDTERPVDAFSDQIAANAIDEGVNAKAVAVQAKRQGFRLER